MLTKIMRVTIKANYKFMNYLILTGLLLLSPVLQISPSFAPSSPATLMAQQTPNQINFEDAIAETQALLEKMASKSISDSEIQITITNLVKTQNGARGFFVTYLTDERPFIDSPSTGIIVALRSSPNIVGELLVKNLVMSSASALAHRRNQDEAMAKGSEQVRDRTSSLIKTVKLPIVSEKLQEMEKSLSTGEGEYEAFLERWGYDAEQKKVMKSAILEVKH
jgi:hypothetical protein